MTLRHTDLEFRERSMDGEFATERTIAFGTGQPVILIEFVGKVGSHLERIIIESTGWNAAEAADMFEKLAVTLRGTPDSSEHFTD